MKNEEPESIWNEWLDTIRSNNWFGYLDAHIVYYIVFCLARPGMTKEIVFIFASLGPLIRISK